MTNNLLSPTTFEVAESLDKDILLSIQMRVSTKVQAPPGEVPVGLTVSLRQNLPLATQLKMIQDAKAVLQQMERALLTGDTDSAGKGPALKA